MEPQEGSPGSYIVYYGILESDEHGRDPYHNEFNYSSKSCLYKIAKNNNMVIEESIVLHA